MKETKTVKCWYWMEHSCILFVHRYNNLYSLYHWQEGLKQMLESWDLAKKVICSIMLPMVNTNSSGAASYSVVSFCKSNRTVFELSLQKLNQVCFPVYWQTQTVRTCMPQFERVLPLTSSLVTSSCWSWCWPILMRWLRGLGWPCWCLTSCRTSPHCGTAC